MHLNVMMFDLSSSTIGVTFASIDEGKITFGDTLAVIPKSPTPRDLGYRTNSPSLIVSHGRRYRGFLKDDEIVITKEEASRRESEVRNTLHNRMLRDIGEQCGRYLDKIRPDVVAIERNKSFNGVLTTKLLAEVAGGLYFYCGARGIEMFDWDEATIRAKIRKDITDFSLFSRDGKRSLDTKWEIHCRLRAFFDKEAPGHFRFDEMTMDESDSLAVFYYWYTKILKEGAHAESGNQSVAETTTQS